MRFLDLLLGNLLGNWATKGQCPQPKKLIPKHSGKVFFTESYRNYSIELLQGAVQINTQSFDDMDTDPLNDPRFNGLYAFSDYLLESFPMCTQHGLPTHVNTFGLVYTFAGSDPALKPIMLTGHLDTVPVNPETAYQWDYDPLGGYYDGEWIHGRGVVDCKNNVVGILEALEHLLTSGWKPTRTIVAAFGFDEEIGGDRGAANINQYLMEQHGRHGFEFILDEGSGQPTIEGVGIIGPFVSERGSLDTQITVSTPGGHSSVPPDHTGIGIMSTLVKNLEANPYVPGIKDWRNHPGAQLYQCLASHSDAVPSSLAAKFLELDVKKNLDALVAYIVDHTSWMVWTSQAIDIIRGGVKINALPEIVTLVTNYRVSIDSSPEEVYAHVEKLAKEVADQYNLGFKTKDDQITTSSNGLIHLEILSQLPVAPVTPWQGKQWEIVTGTMRHIFEDLVPVSKSIVAPSVVSGNTDTAHYWDLSTHIYRYSPVFLTDALNKHTVNERIKADAHLGAVAFYYELLLNYE